MTALADKLRALLAGGAALAAEIEAFELSRPTPPAPAPVPALDPEPLSAGPLAVMSVNPAAEVIFAQWSPDLSRYTRAQGIMRLAGSAAKVRIIGFSTAKGGVHRPFSGGTYSLLIDGAQTATVTPAAGASTADFTVDATALDAGWHELRAVPSVPGESCLPYFALVVHDGVAVGSDYTPVARGSYWLSLHPPLYHWGKAPATYNPTPRPLPVRERVAFSTLLPPAELHVEQLVPLRFGDTHRVCRTTEGALSSFAAQPYHWSTLTAKLPGVPLLDGPRGVGTVCMATHVEVGMAAPPSMGFVNNTYFCDPWRFGKVRADGTVVTLAGYRHKGIAAHWQNSNPTGPEFLELVGDWSAIPAERRGFRELWGMAWDERTFVTNEAADPIPAERNLKPHITGIVVFLADSQNNRVCKLEFSPTSHAVPPKITEFITGVLDPWDVVCADGVLYVSERQSHRIAAYDATSGALLRVVVQGQPLARIDAVREVQRLASLDACRAAVAVAPEGLFLQDGWLYWASKAQAQVKRVSLATGAVEFVRTILTDDNTKFAKIALSDGTFGPRGLVAVAQWSNRDYGWTQMTTDTAGWALGYASYLHQITGPNAQFVYATSVGFGGGQMIIGGVNEGLLRVSKKLPGDAVASASAKAGYGEYVAQGLDILHGAGGHGYYGLPLPWGLSENIDAFLTHNGHAKA